MADFYEDDFDSTGSEPSIQGPDGAALISQVSAVEIRLRRRMELLASRIKFTTANPNHLIHLNPLPRQIAYQQSQQFGLVKSVEVDAVCKMVDKTSSTSVIAVSDVATETGVTNNIPTTNNLSMSLFPRMSAIAELLSGGGMKHMKVTDSVEVNELSALMYAERKLKENKLISSGEGIAMIKMQQLERYIFILVVVTGNTEHKTESLDTWSFSNMLKSVGVTQRKEKWFPGETHIICLGKQVKEGLNTALFVFGGFSRFVSFVGVPGQCFGNQDIVIKLVGCTLDDELFMWDINKLLIDSIDSSGFCVTQPSDVISNFTKMLKGDTDSCKAAKTTCHRLNSISYSEIFSVFLLAVGDAVHSFKLCEKKGEDGSFTVSCVSKLFDCALCGGVDGKCGDDSSGVNDVFDLLSQMSMCLGCLVVSANSAAGKGQKLVVVCSHCFYIIDAPESALPLCALTDSTNPQIIPFNSVAPPKAIGSSRFVLFDSEGFTVFVLGWTGPIVVAKGRVADDEGGKKQIIFDLLNDDKLKKVASGLVAFTIQSLEYQRIRETEELF